MRALLLILCAGLAGCSGGSQCKQVESQGQSVASWAATAQMISKHWSASDLPTQYARKTLSQGEQQVRRSAGTLERASERDPTAAPALSAYKRLANILGEMVQAVDRNDRRTVKALTSALPKLHEQISDSRSRCQSEESSKG